MFRRIKRLWLKHAVIRWYGKYSTRVLRCNKSTNPDCACNKVVSLSKKRRPVGVEAALENMRLLEEHAAKVKAEKGQAWPLDFSAEMDKLKWEELEEPAAEQANYSLTAIFIDPSNPVRHFTDLTEQAAKQKFLDITMLEEPLYIEALKDGKVIVNSMYPKMLNAPKC